MMDTDTQRIVLLGITFLAGCIFGGLLERATSATKWFRAAYETELARRANVERVKQEFREKAEEDTRSREATEWPEEIEAQ